MSEIINRVAQSSLITIDVEDLYPEDEIVEIDLRNVLFQESILREKDFRLYVKDVDWSQYKDKAVAIFCSVDAIIPVWSYMILTAAITPYTSKIIMGDKAAMLEYLFQCSVSKMNPKKYINAKVVVKGCSRRFVPESVHVQITKLLQPVVSTLMYGEPCSTVSVYKRPKQSR